MKLSNNDILITPLGGLGQIGSNMSLIESRDESIVIDAGLLFPRETSTGVQYLIPNFYGVEKSKIKALFITHCHEDHIGALEHFLNYIPNIKIYTEKFTSHVIQKKVKKNKLNLSIIDEFFFLKFKSFEVNSFRVNHSTAETLGFIISNSNNSIIFASDFKIDHTPKRENTFDFERINKVSRKKTKIALIDSTNILRKDKTLSESQIIPRLEQLISKKRRILLTFFPSNIHRFLNLIKICHKKSKIPVLYGKAMHFYYECAQKSGLIRDNDYGVSDIESVDTNRDDLVIFVSGCQGNFRSTLSNIAQNQSPLIKLKDNDLFVYSASIIPGNEKQVYKIFNLLTEQGVEIITSSDGVIHCSGHPGKEDIDEFIEQTSPQYLIPIHGESYFLKKHADYINSKYKDIKTILTFNHDSLLINHNISLIKKQAIDPLLVTYNSKIIDKKFISERRKLGENGVLFITLEKKQAFIKERGMELSSDYKISLISSIENLIKKNKSQEDVRISIRRKLRDHLGHKPLVEIIDIR